jgi:hypothetical protein
MALEAKHPHNSVVGL